MKIYYTNSRYLTAEFVISTSRKRGKAVVLHDYAASPIKNRLTIADIRT
ncbi:Uncharacterized protein APZ42_016720 [Daphnia magna]|uniref:Uncharacterized protein n=1 Tax=Daphnia magna TaxID=35525 RepID=A0A165A407_9CRUS|nr:Uncharacterized protein APZ42_016720 [Daphnia magna]